MKPQVTFRGIFPTEGVVQAVWRRARALAAIEPGIERCHVIVERLDRGREANARFRVSLLLSGTTHSTAIQAPPYSMTASDIHVALRDLFAAARRRLARPWLLPRPTGARLGVQH